MSVLKQAEGGMAVPELCRERGMSSATFRAMSSDVVRGSKARG
jgi:hypothetical protein